MDLVTFTKEIVNEKLHFLAVLGSTNQMFTIGSNQMMVYKYHGLQRWTGPAICRSRTGSSLCFQALAPLKRLV